jgi:tyrosine-protein kinase Etk/Wzc
MENKTENTGLNTDNLLILLWTWRKPIIVVMVLAVIGSAAVSLIIREKFLSTAIIFPGKASTVELGEKFNMDQSVTQFGEEEEAEQLLQILNSSEIRDYIITKYKLLEHYEIDEDSPYAYTYLVKEYNSNVTCERTRHNSIEINVLDYDPETAANMANDIARLVDSTKNRMIRERAMHAFKVVEREFQSLTKETENLRDTLTALSQLGVIPSTEGQAKLYEAYATAISQRNTVNIEQISKQLDINKNYAPAYRYFDGLLQDKSEQLNDLEKVYKQALTETTISIPHKFSLEKARAAEKKEYPVRWLIVVMSTIGSFLFMIAFIVVFEKIKQIRSTVK